VRAVFVDRDGVINRNRSDYVTTLEQFQFLPNALAGLALLAETEYAIVVVTNQSAVGQGLLSEATLSAIHNWMCQCVRAAQGRLDGIYVCPHLRTDNCACRKPRPGLLLQAAEALGLELTTSYLIGDSTVDVDAALRVGSQPILVRTGLGVSAQAQLVESDISGYRLANDLYDAACQILGRSQRRDRRAFVASEPALARHPHRGSPS